MNTRMVYYNGKTYLTQQSGGVMAVAICNGVISDHHSLRAVIRTYRIR